MGGSLLAAHSEHGGKAGESGRAVDDKAAREVANASLGEPAAAPDPVAPGAVDQREPQHHEDDVGFEANLADKGASDQGWGDGSEHLRRRQEDEACN